MTLLVRDEVDIVDANISYHLSQGVDFVIATDHSSQDGTADVLRAYEREGRLLLREVGGEAHDQVRHVNAMARAAAVDHGADWVINNDADEFWWPLYGSLKDVLGAIPEEFGAIVAQRFNFVPPAGASGPLLERMIVREAVSKNGRGGPLEPKVAHRAMPEIEMAPGNHSIEAPELAVAPDIGLLEVLHFPMRSFDQFERKVLNVGIGYERLETRGPEVGRDQLALLEVQREGRLRAHYDDRAVAEADLEAALASGRLLIDTRLRDHQAALDPPGGDRPRPDADGTRKIVSTALGLAAELARSRQELDAARADAHRAERQLDAARAGAHRAERQLDAARAGHDRAERELESALATLQAVRASRLMRYSEPLRRLYYRLRGKGEGLSSPR